MDCLGLLATREGRCDGDHRRLGSQRVYGNLALKETPSMGRVNRSRCDKQPWQLHTHTLSALVTGCYRPFHPEKINNPTH